ncbi:MAG: redox-sensitive bicupin YhaK (pirin superfamily) [Cryomorphaceae bacterium]|jgi:redox-sensitive bicupin YhaK (pirin superfamily)
MKKVIHRADTRGHADHGWLNTHHSFSFASYSNPERGHFGMLRVLNDDTVTGGRGFGTHPHENMEIISIPLEGDLEHNDSMGTSGVIRKNDVQLMSAGTGVYHSEKNRNGNEAVNFLQLWIFPKHKGIAPRYDQKTFEPSERKDQFQEVVSPLESSGTGVKINQRAYLHMVDMTAGTELTYQVKEEGNGVYVFVLKGDMTIEGESLGKRDAIGITETDRFKLEAAANAELLLIEVPMN